MTQTPTPAKTHSSEGTFLIVGHASESLDDVLAALQKHPKATLIALDGVAPCLVAHNIHPDYVLGDLDSLAQHQHLPECFEQALAFFDTQDTPDDAVCVFEEHRSGTITFVRACSQNASDLNKGIQFALRSNAQRIILLNVLGGQRSDHTLLNFSLLKKFSNIENNPNGVPLRIESQTEIVECLANQEVTFQGPLGGKVGLFGCPEAVVHASKGLKWPLQAYPLIFGQHSSACNEIDASLEGHVFLSIEGHALLMRPNPS